MLLTRRFRPSQHSDYLMAGIYNSHNHHYRPRIYPLYAQEGPGILQDKLKRSEKVPVLPKEPIVPISNGILAAALNIDLRLLYARTEYVETLYHTLRSSFFKCGRSTYWFENMVRQFGKHYEKSLKYQAANRSLIVKGIGNGKRKKIYCS